MIDSKTQLECPRRLALLSAALMIGGCQLSAAPPPCPFPGPGDSAPSAGCFTVKDGKLLLVQNFEDRLSPPGGSSRPGESAQCAAYRETWEETGLEVQPRELLEVFDTGFHLYRCELTDASGEIGPPPRFEIQAAFYLAPEEFDRWEWRYPEQRETLADRLSERARQRP